MDVERILNILLGGALAILAGLTVALIKEWRDGIKTRRVARNVIAVETIHNLFTLDGLESAMKRTLELPGSVRYSPTYQIRTAVLRQVVSPPTFASLTEAEQTFLLHTLGGLDHVEHLYQSWIDRQVGAVQILNATAPLGQNVMNLLLFTCKLAAGDLADEEAREIAHKLRHIRTKDLKRSGTLGIPRRSSFLIGNDTFQPDKTIIVWEHDWSECPAKEVIALRPER